MNTNQTIPTVDSRGFTLIELMIALFIGLFLVAGVVTMVDFSTRTYRAQERVADAQQDARAALEIMARDIRMAGFSPQSFLSNAGEQPAILTSTADTIRIVADLDLSGAIEVDTEEDITYTLSGGVLSRITQGPSAANPPSPLMSNVSSMTIEYFNYSDGTWSAASTDGTVAVRITLQCQGRDASGGTFQRTLSTTVAVRNLTLRPIGAV